MELNLDASITGGLDQAISLDDAQIAGALRKMVTKDIKAMIIQTFHQVIGGSLNSGAGNSGGSEQVSNSDYAQIGLALRKMIKKEIEVIVVRTFNQEIGRPSVEDLMRKVFKEEIQSALEKCLIGGNRNSEHEIGMSTERNLQLKFLDEVSVEVLTGKEIIGKQDTPIRVTLVDPTTELVVKTGPEASANVEIFVLESSSDDNEQELSIEEFNNRIITEKDKEKPHFTKRMFLHLKEGVGILSNVKLAQDSVWTRTCQCRLGARIENNFSGIKVKEARTERFKVSDSRNNLYEKHYPPRLSDNVWRLENIGRNGNPFKRLAKENILTVKDFLFLLRIDRPRLENIVGTGAKMTATVDHAQTCIIDDNKIYIHCPSSDLKEDVAFDVVGRLKGLIRDSCYVPVTNLSEDEKAHAHELLLSAFEKRNGWISFEDKTSLLHHFSYKSSGIDAATNYSTLDDPSEGDSTSDNGDVPSELGTLSHSIIPNNFNCFGSRDSTFIEQLHELNLGDCSEGTSCLFSDVDFRKRLDDYCHMLKSLIYSGSHSHQQSKTRSILIRAGVVMLWFFRARKRVKALEDVRVTKRQKIG